jgi:hypothetical protein
VTYIVQFQVDFQSPVSDLTKPCRTGRIAAINNQIAEIKRLGPHRDHEVEVLSRERYANPGRFQPGENRIDQRVPLEFVTDSFLPSKEAQGVKSAQHTGENSVAQLKTGRQRAGEDSAVKQAVLRLLDDGKGCVI